MKGEKVGSRLDELQIATGGYLFLLFLGLTLVGTILAVIIMFCT